MYELMIGAGADRERSVPALVVVGGVCLQSFFSAEIFGVNNFLHTFVLYY